MVESSMSYHCSTRHRATLVPPTRGVPPPRGCCDTVPALTRCGLPQQSPPGVGSTKTHRRSQQRRKAAQQCRRIECARSWNSTDWTWIACVAGIRKSLRKQCVATAGSTLRSLPECSDESSNRDEGDGSFLDGIVDWSKHGAAGSVLERVEANRDVDLNLGNCVEADSGAESISGSLCAEFGRDIVLDSSKRVPAASGREKLSGLLCADSGRVWDIDLNMSKRDEADSGLEHFLGDPCVIFGRNIGGFGRLQVSKQVHLCSLSSLDLYVDSSKRVDAGMALHILCLTENPWTVLDPTVNMVCRIDDLELLSVAHLETRTRWRTRPCVLARALIGHANAVWESGLGTSVSDRNLTLMNGWQWRALSALDVRSAQCTFSHSLIQHLALIARTSIVKCSGASIVGSSRASNAGKAAPATAAVTMSSIDYGTPEGGRGEWAPTSRVLMVRFASAVSS